MKPVTQRQPLDISKWNNGLITEASPLNFPEGASVDEENFVLNRKGYRSRRLGIDYEASATLVSLGTLSASTQAIQNFLWENVRENPQDNFLVHQVGHRLYFFDADTTAVSSNLLFSGGISLTATTNTRFSFASIQGNLIVATGDQTLRILSVSTDASGTYSITLSFTRLKVRDFWGVDDSLYVDQRYSGTFSTTAGGRHAYNLYNQGWPPQFFCSADPENPTSMNNGTTEDPVERTKTSLGAYPSNADVMASAMTFLTNGRKAYYPWALNNIVSGNTPAANGHYIIDLFARSQGRIDTYAQDVSAGWSARYNFTSWIPTDTSTGGIRAVAAYAGRIFYALSPGENGGDSRSPHLGTFILFSKLVDSKTDLEKCYQEADPTSQDISDIIDTDGGYIQIPDIVDVRALVPFGQALLIFAANGVWAVYGGDAGFTATEYQSDFITNNGALSAESIIVTESSILYWSRNGVYIISAEASTQVITAGKLAPQSISRDTIQTLYESIPYRSKVNAAGYYDDTKYIARWLYQEEHNAGQPQAYTHELILDTSIPAWSRFEFKELDTNSPHVNGYIPVPIQSRDNARSDYKYSAVTQDASGTFAVTAAHFRNTNFVDWYSADSSATSTASRGVDAEAYLITGYVTGGDSARKKYLPYLTTHFQRTEGIQVDDQTTTLTVTASATDTYAGDLILLLIGDSFTDYSQYAHVAENISAVSVISGQYVFEDPVTVTVSVSSSAIGFVYKAGSGTEWEFPDSNFCIDGIVERRVPPMLHVFPDISFHGSVENIIGRSRTSTFFQSWQVMFENRTDESGTLVHSILSFYCSGALPMGFEWTVTTSNTHHFAIERTGQRIAAFWDGVQIGTSLTLSTVSGVSSDPIVVGNGEQSLVGATYYKAPIVYTRINKLRITGTDRYGGPFTPPTEFPVP